jgi:hypothetical protein
MYVNNIIYIIICIYIYISILLIIIINIIIIIYIYYNIYILQYYRYIYMCGTRFLWQDCTLRYLKICEVNSPCSVRSLKIFYSWTCFQNKIMSLASEAGGQVGKLISLRKATTEIEQHRITIVSAPEMGGLQRNLPNNASSENSELLFGVFKQFILTASILSNRVGSRTRQRRQGWCSSWSLCWTLSQVRKSEHGWCSQCSTTAKTTSTAHAHDLVNGSPEARTGTHRFRSPPISSWNSDSMAITGSKHNHSLTFSHNALAVLKKL